ncbi:hypothetical protein HJG60_010035 [Phyllostomus discolor]|uniref:Uncharacterized protein n=1 Tax=Phyllostomus discolor TaxID=89673 RepID=A0A834AZ25_9CHIR|nr:hypothetical protein HJG60_010035 [Phyllostomus discolor]
MAFGVGCRGERLFAFLCVAHTFVLAGTVCFYFQGSVGEPAPGHDIAGDTSQPPGETLRPVWGPMDKCYPGASQRRRVRSGRKEAAEAGTPRGTGGPSDAAPREEPGVRPQDAGEPRPPAEDAASPTPAGKDVAEEAAAAAGTPAARALLAFDNLSRDSPSSLNGELGAPVVADTGGTRHRCRWCCWAGGGLLP